MTAAISWIIAIRELELPSLEKAVLWALASRCDAKGTCFPSYDTLRRDAGCSVRGAKSAVKLLAGRGLIAIEKRTADTGVNASNLYRLSAATGMVQEAHPMVHQVHHHGASGAPPMVQEVHDDGARRAHEAIQVSAPSEAIQKKDPPTERKTTPKKGQTAPLFEVDATPGKAPTDHQRIVETWVTEYKRTHRGQEPTMKGTPGKRAFKAVKDLLESMGADLACETIRAAYEDQWFVEKQGGALPFIAANPDKYKRAPKPSRPELRPLRIDDEDRPVPPPPETLALIQSLLTRKGPGEPPSVHADVVWTPKGKVVASNDDDQAAGLTVPAPQAAAALPVAEPVCIPGDTEAVSMPASLASAFAGLTAHPPFEVRKVAVREQEIAAPRNGKENRAIGGAS